jgi:hypothetical protein
MPTAGSAYADARFPAYIRYYALGGRQRFENRHEVEEPRRPDDDPEGVRAFDG